MPANALLGWALVAFGILYSARGWSHRIAFCLVAIGGVVLFLPNDSLALTLAALLTGLNLGRSVVQGYFLDRSPADRDGSADPS